jgi:hypothetical protein
MHVGYQPVILFGVSRLIIGNQTGSFTVLGVKSTLAPTLGVEWVVSPFAPTLNFSRGNCYGSAPTRALPYQIEISVGGNDCDINYGISYVWVKTTTKFGVGLLGKLFPISVLSGDVFNAFPGSGFSFQFNPVIGSLTLGRVSWGVSSGDCPSNTDLRTDASWAGKVCSDPSVAIPSVASVLYVVNASCVGLLDATPYKLCVILDKDGSASDLTAVFEQTFTPSSVLHTHYWPSPLALAPIRVSCDHVSPFIMC